MKLGRAARELKLSGVFASAITPNRPGTLEVDYSSLLDLLDFLAQGGADGICLMGTLGEFVNYSFSDRQRAVYLGAKRSRVPLIVGVSHTSLSGALQLADDAVGAGADALLLMPPFFYPCKQPEIEDFYRQFARVAQSPIPILLDNAPQFTSAIPLDTVRRLIGTGLFAGIRDASGDWEYFQSLLALKQERGFSLFMGTDAQAMRALASGADGLFSDAACALPETVAGLRRAIAAGDQAMAEKTHSRLVEFDAWSAKFAVPAAIKKAVAIRGQKAGEFAVPLASETARLMEEFSAWFGAFIKH